MYQTETGVGGGMLKRHFTVIYSQLDEMKERLAKLESTITDANAKMDEVQRKLSQVESGYNRYTETDKISKDLATAVADLRREINSLRARLEAELLSLGEPLNSHRPQTPAPEPTQQPASLPVESSEPKSEPDPAQAASEPSPSEEKPQNEEPSTQNILEPSSRSIEEELGLVKSEEKQEEPEAQAQDQGKPEEKKKRRWL